MKELNELGDLDRQMKELRCYGKILMQHDSEVPNGFASSFKISYKGEIFLINMKNGRTINVDKY